jgi:uncharacterized repeat protein (TIGR01451 family)
MGKNRMSQEEKAPERERRDWIIILIILLLGLLSVIIAGGWAIHFSPTWSLNTDMGSNIDPNSDFLTNNPEFIEPLDPSILTQPAWINVFLTPGASFETSIPATPLPTNTFSPTFTIVPTITSTLPSIPTNTFVYVPPPPPTRTPNPPPTPLDLQITKTDGATTYVAGSTVTYTIIVANNGPNNVNGAMISDAKPVQVTSWNWVCSAIVNAGGCDAVLGSTTNFTDIVNIQSGGSITYTVTASINVGATSNLVNTASVSVPSGYRDTNNGNNSATDTDTFSAPGLMADLQITKTDNATHYLANATKTYIIVVYNAGPANVTGATVTDAFSTNTNIASINWTCVGSAGGSCTAGGSGDINDTVNLPSGSSVTYTATVNVSASPSGDLINTVAVTPPGAINDPVPGNNTATDTDTLIVSSGTSYGNIGTGQNGIIENLNAGDSIILTLTSPITVNGSHAGPDIIYYEQDIGGIEMDWVILEVGDGSNWYTILNWGDGVSDFATNIAIPLAVPPNSTDCSGEPDNCPIDASILSGGSGVIIDLDALIPTIPNGTVVSFIRITVPLGGTDAGVGIDGIYVVP